tara:strand:- start:869 stop:1867 length:999 start_codon:yes stop_codon:yes gene_type:complete
MNMERKFPSTRLRRLRTSKKLIDLVSENTITSNDLIQPLFIKENLSGTESIKSMPDILRYGKDEVNKEIKNIINCGINTIALFPIIKPELKNSSGSEAINKDNFICSMIKQIKDEYPEIIIIADVALDPYTDHGHDGVLNQDYVDNDATVNILVEQSLLLAASGADIIAPSDMMDGRIAKIRQSLESEGFINTILLSYAAKFNSHFYGPFREAIGSSSKLQGSSKSSYQMNTANYNEAYNEVALDINEGADIVMVKPALAYLDVINMIKKEFKVPTFAYQVSGEYSMIQNAIKEGWLDKNVMLESLLSIKRAGADAILSYAAKDISLEIKNL